MSNKTQTYNNKQRDEVVNALKSNDIDNIYFNEFALGVSKNDILSSSLPEKANKEESESFSNPLESMNVAKYILDKKGVMSAMKLQKLVYYSQAWSLVWDDEPVFDDAIKAWANGPVIPSLYNIHKWMYQVSSATYANYAKN